jgi:RimJ/RimL family protein N-acetyltransferase
VRVRQATLADLPALRGLRLQAMIDAPDAFSSNYDREASRSTAEWQRWIAPGATFLLDQPDDTPMGLVAVRHRDAEPNTADLMAMWVHPSSRATGGADLLVRAVLDWAASAGIRTVMLGVEKQNERARRVYERNGFQATGEEKPIRDELVEIVMTRDVG